MSITATKESFKYDVSFLFGEGKNSKFVNDIYVNLTEKQHLKCLLPTSPLELELDDAKYALVFFSKDTAEQIPQYCLKLVSHKLQKSGVNIIPVLIDVDTSQIPSYLQWLTYVECRKDANNFMDRIVEIVTGPDQEIRSPLPVGDVYIGLALGYYHNYLSFILQAYSANWEKTKEMVTQECVVSKETLGQECLVSTRFFIVLPASCSVPTALSSNDSNISHVKAIPLAVKNDAGSRGRSYKGEIYKVTDGIKEFYFFGAYATPVLTLSEMVEDETAELSHQEMENQVQKFKDLLEKLLESESELRDKYCMVYYDDTKTSLSEELLKNLQEEFK